MKFELGFRIIMNQVWINDYFILPDSTEHMELHYVEIRHAYCEDGENRAVIVHLDEDGHHTEYNLHDDWGEAAKAIHNNNMQKQGLLDFIL